MTVMSTSQTTFAERSSDIADLQLQLNAVKTYIAELTLNTSYQSVTQVPDSVVRASIQDGVQWLMNAQEKNGHFTYEFLPYEDAYKPGDNIVRQAGALFILSEVARRSSAENKKTADTIEIAIAYFEGLSPLHTYDGDTVACVQKTAETQTCMLGATALALTGILGYVEANPSKAAGYKQTIEAYKTFILKSRKEEGGFRDEYRLGTGFREKESPFSNGEALLALVRYQHFNGYSEVQTTVDTSFTYLKSLPYDTSLYLWMMAALKDMQVLSPKDEYVQYAKAFTQWRMNLLVSSRSTLRNYCASTEGLVSAYSLLEDHSTSVELQSLRHEINYWNQKNLLLQVSASNPYRLITEGGKFVLAKNQNIEQSAGGFLTADEEPTQRIDFTQHCVSSYLQTLVDIDGIEL